MWVSWYIDQEAEPTCPLVLTPPPSLTHLVLIDQCWEALWPVVIITPGLVFSLLLFNGGGVTTIQDCFPPAWHVGREASSWHMHVHVHVATCTVPSSFKTTCTHDTWCGNMCSSLTPLWHNHHQTHALWLGRLYQILSRWPAGVFLYLH